MAEEFERRAAKHVGARLGREVDDPSVEAPELRRRTVRLDSELLNRVDGRKVGDLPRLGLQHGNAIEQILVGAWTTAVDARQLRRRRQRHARCERCQPDEAAAVQREAIDLLRGYELTETGSGPLQGGVPGDGHSLTYTSHGQLDIEPDGFAGLELNALMANWGESIQLDLEAVRARRKSGNCVNARSARYGLARCRPVQIDGHHGRARHGGARRIRDNARNLTSAYLAVRAANRR